MTRAVVVCLALLIYAVLSMDLITDSQGLVVYTLLLLGYLSVEFKNLWGRETDLFWINPVVLASVVTFAMAFGVTNVLYFMPEDMVFLVGLEPIATPWMNHLMLLVVLAACAMWAGYWSPAGRGIALALQQSDLVRSLVRKNLRVRMWAIFACLGISLLVKLVTIWLGIYGYSSTYERLVELAPYRAYLSMAGDLGSWALVGMALQYYSQDNIAKNGRSLLAGILTYETAFGFLSGFKSAVVMPFLIVGFAYYSQRNRFPRWLLPTIVVALFAAYTVIEPFRAALPSKHAEYIGTSVGSILTAMTSDSSMGTDDGGEGASIGLQVLARVNQTYVASLGIEYAANSELPEGSPAFLDDIFLAPAHAVIPRLLWESKPMQTTGSWYTHQVMGDRESETSTGMSAVTYLNFAGGPLAVILGFLIVGIFQRGLFDGLRHLGGGGLFVLFGLLGMLVIIDSAFNAFIGGIIRLPPILVLAQYVLLQRPPRS